MKKELLLLCFLIAVLGCDERAETDTLAIAKGIATENQSVGAISIMNKNEITNDDSPFDDEGDEISEEELREIDRINSEASAKAAKKDIKHPEKLAPGGPPPVVSIMFSGMENGKTRAQRAIGIEVKNVTKEEISIDAQLQSSGLISKMSTKSLGSATLKAEEKVVLSLDADKMPIQSLNNISQFRVKVEVTHQTPVGPQKRTILSTAFYYKHSKDYREVSVFDFNEFMSEYKGILIQPALDQKEAEQVMGRIYDGKNYNEITYLDESNVVRKAGGGEIREMGMSISIEVTGDSKKDMEVSR
jgi:hypothetical protein